MSLQDDLRLAIIRTKRFDKRKLLNGDDLIQIYRDLELIIANMGVGAGVWGSITGIITTQADLVAYVASVFVDATDLVKGKMKLYNTTGSNTDGTVTQALFSSLATAVTTLSTTLASSILDIAVLQGYPTLKDRGDYSVSGINLFPSTGGSGAAGAILKGDIWRLSSGGNLGLYQVEAGMSIRAMTDAPGQTDANWNIIIDINAYNALILAIGAFSNIINGTTDITAADFLSAVTGATLTGHRYYRITDPQGNASHKVYVWTLNTSQYITIAWFNSATYFKAEYDVTTDKLTQIVDTGNNVSLSQSSSDSNAIFGSYSADAARKNISLVNCGITGWALAGNIIEGVTGANSIIILPTSGNPGNINGTEINNATATFDHDAVFSDGYIGENTALTIGDSTVLTGCTIDGGRPVDIPPSLNFTNCFISRERSNFSLAFDCGTSDVLDLSTSATLFAGLLNLTCDNATQDINTLTCAGREFTYVRLFNQPGSGKIFYINNSLFLSTGNITTVDGAQQPLREGQYIEFYIDNNGNPIQTSATLAFVREYTVYISQSAIGNPAVDAIVINQLEGAPAFTRNSAGNYTLTLTGAFPNADKVFPLGKNGSATEYIYFVGRMTSTPLLSGRVAIQYNDANSLTILTSGALGASDDILDRFPLSFKVYP